MNRVLFVFLFILLGFSSSLYADPKVGEFAQWQTQITRDGSTILADELKEIIDYDSVTGKYLVRATFSFGNNEPTVTENWLYKYEIPYFDQSIIDNCEKYDGSKKVDISVPAGTFESCAVPVIFTNETDGKKETFSGTVWFVPIPFGWVAMDFTSDLGSQVTGQLMSYQAIP